MYYANTFKQFQKEQFEQFCKWQECGFVMSDIVRKRTG